MGTRSRNISARKSLQTQSGTNLHAAMRGTLYDVESQFRRSTQIKGVNGNRRPSGLKEGDLTTRLASNGSIEIAVSDARGNQQAISIPSNIADLPTGLYQYINFQTGAVPPAIGNFPTDGDWGQYYDTATAALYWGRNIGGSLVFPHFLGITGTISDTQHGDRSTTATTMHGFNQITGTITNAQHGNRGGGTLHDAVTGAANGFMIAADKTKLDNATASGTASTLVLRDGSGGITGVNGTFTGNVDITGAVDTDSLYRVNGVRVVDDRQTGWALWTGTTSRATHATYTAPVISSPPTQAEVQAIANALQNVTRAFFALQTDLGSTSGHGLIDA